MTPEQRRMSVTTAKRTAELSEHRACLYTGFARSSQRYQTRHPRTWSCPRTCGVSLGGDGAGLSAAHAGAAHADAHAHSRECPAIEIDFSLPGARVLDRVVAQNAFIESFNGPFRNECLNQHSLVTLPDAPLIIEAWRTGYETERPR